MKIEDVNKDWLINKMKELNIGFTDMVKETRLNKGNASGYINGGRAMGTTIKALIYYYIKYKEAESLFKK